MSSSRQAPYLEVSYPNGARWEKERKGKEEEKEKEKKRNAKRVQHLGLCCIFKRKTSSHHSLEWAFSAARIAADLIQGVNLQQNGRYLCSGTRGDEATAQPNFLSSVGSDGEQVFSRGEEV